MSVELTDIVNLRDSGLFKHFTGTNTVDLKYWSNNFYETDETLKYNINNDINRRCVHKLLHNKSDDLDIHELIKILLNYQDTQCIMMDYNCCMGKLLLTCVLF